MEPKLKKHILTEKQQAVYGFIEEYFRERSMSPLIREIQSTCQIRSYKSVLDRLGALERKGFITRLANKHRGIRLVRPAAQAQPLAESASAEQPA